MEADKNILLIGQEEELKLAVKHIGKKDVSISRIVKDFIESGKRGKKGQQFFIVPRPGGHVLLRPVVGSCETSIDAGLLTELLTGYFGVESDQVSIVIQDSSI